MLNCERRERILEILEAKKTVSAKELSRTLFVSMATVRRDLTEMEREGLLRRHHGGAAALLPENEEKSLLLRESTSAKEKARIARAAAEYITDGSCIFIDPSSTCSMLIPYLAPHKGLKIVTNGLKSAMLLDRAVDAEIYIPSGRINKNSNSVVGIDTYDYLSRLSFDIAFFSCAGVDPEAAYEVSLEQATLKRLAMSRSRSNIMLVDSSKLGTPKMFKLCELSAPTVIITDRTPPEGFFVTAKALVIADER